jgi:hypothetical protein
MSAESVGRHNKIFSLNKFGFTFSERYFNLCSLDKAETVVNITTE